MINLMMVPTDQDLSCGMNPASRSDMRWIDMIFNKNMLHDVIWSPIEEVQVTTILINHRVVSVIANWHFSMTILHAFIASPTWEQHIAGRCRRATRGTRLQVQCLSDGGLSAVWERYNGSYGKSASFHGPSIRDSHYCLVNQFPMVLTR